MSPKQIIKKATLGQGVLLLLLIAAAGVQFAVSRDVSAVVWKFIFFAMSALILTVVHLWYPETGLRFRDSLSESFLFRIFDYLFLGSWAVATLFLLFLFFPPISRTTSVILFIVALLIHGILYLLSFLTAETSTPAKQHSSEEIVQKINKANK